MRRRNGTILNRNRGSRLPIELTDFNDEPEQLLVLARKAEIEYAAAKAKWEYTTKREAENEPFNEVDCEDEMNRAALQKSRDIGWMS